MTSAPIHQDDEPTPPPTGRAGSLAVPGDPPAAVTWSRRAEVTEVEIHATDLDTADAARVTAVTAAVGAISRNPDIAGSRIHLAADHAPDVDHRLPTELATALGLAPRRELLQLRRPLPVPRDAPSRAGAPTLATRPFRPADDEAAWLRANNRAFASHPDQGAETPATLASRAAEDWFDLDDFLVVDDPDHPGELAGFCWTKVHQPTDQEPALGEIYVIGVDPDHQGEGLGRALVLAGLDHLADRGIRTAVLYVEADNTPARALYQRLGFSIHQRRRVYAP